MLIMSSMGQNNSGGIIWYRQKKDQKFIVGNIKSKSGRNRGSA